MSPKTARPRSDIDEQLAFEQLLADLSFRPVQFVPGDTERPMSDTDIERRTGEALGLVRSALMRRNGSPSARVGFIDERLASLLGIPAADHDSLDEYWLEHVHPYDVKHVRAVFRQVEVHG